MRARNAGVWGGGLCLWLAVQTGTAAAQTPAVLPATSAAEGLPSWSSLSTQTGSSFGAEVAGIGDVNGDGYDDIAVGAPTSSAGQAGEGKVFVHLGSASGPVSPASWSVEPNVAGAAFGTTLAGPCDVNGDGFSDLIVGAPEEDGAMGVGVGVVRAFYGAASGLPATASWTRQGGVAEQHLGQSLACAGDVNGDGFDDIVAGSPVHPAKQGLVGIVAVFLGSASGLATAPAITRYGNNVDTDYGWSVGNGGDVNGDGLDDLLVGVPRWIQGPPPGTVVGAVEIRVGAVGAPSVQPDWRATGTPDSFFGSAVSGAGDVNGDGHQDLLFGQSAHEGTAAGEGRGVVYLGSPTGPDLTVDWNHVSGQAGAACGATVAGLGDVNGDGYDDVAIGCPLFDGSSADTGAIFVAHGTASGPGDIRWNGGVSGNGSMVGQGLAAAGDVNGDGYADLVAGAPFRNNPSGGEGAAYVFFGSPWGLNNDNEKPSVPPAFAPGTGEVVDGTLTIQWGAVVDLEGDPVAYDLELADMSGTVLASLYLTQPTGAVPWSWQPAVTLEEDTMYQWRVRAQDPFGASDWFPWLSFTIDRVVNPDTDPPDTDTDDTDPDTDPVDTDDSDPVETDLGPGDDKDDDGGCAHVSAGGLATIAWVSLFSLGLRRRRSSPLI